MSDKTIYNTSVLDLLPPNLKQKPDIVAASKAVDKGFYDVVNQVRLLSILSNLNEQDEAVLDHLLWQFHITEDEGASLAETREEKINLIENAFEIHRMKGTKAALERVLDLLNMTGIIREWFEYNGEPYMFRVDIQVRNKGLSERTITLLERLINTYKNLRSWVEVINFYLTSNSKLYVASATYYGEEITVYPWQASSIESKGSFKLGTASQSVETLSVYPQ